MKQEISKTINTSTTSIFVAEIIATMVDFVSFFFLTLLTFVCIFSSAAYTDMELSLIIFPAFDFVEVFVTFVDLLLETFSAFASLTDLATFAIGSFKLLDVGDLVPLPDLPNNGGAVVVIIL